MSRYPLDDLEKAIVSQLNEDARKPFQTIARELSVDEKTVRNRIAKLREKGVLSLVPVADPNVLDKCMVALVAVGLLPPARHNPDIVIEKLAALPMVSWVGVTLGAYDLVAEVIVADVDELANFELKQLSAIEGVGNTQSLLILSQHGNCAVPFLPNMLRRDSDS